MRVDEDIRAASPAKASRADHGGSLRAAVDLKCLECAGGSRTEVERCEALRCFLWPHRPGRDDRVRPAGMVPTAEEYARAADERLTDAQRAARVANGDRLRAARAGADDDAEVRDAG